MIDPLSVAAAEALIAQHMPAWGSEVVTLDAAVGRVLRQDVLAERDQPPFDRVMMDGIALRWQPSLPRRFALAGTQLAGMPALALVDPDTCLEVTTGAMLPDGCDCVVPVEQIRREGNDYFLFDGHRPAQNQFIHPRGSDCLAGSHLLVPGVRIGAPEIAVLAANGVADVEVAMQPAIAVVATGDELVDVAAPLGEGRIRRSNDRALAALLRLRGLDRVALSQVGDDLPATIAALDRLLATHAVVILSGGVSMGQRDYVPAAMETLGVRCVFHRVAQRPGKPLWFGIGPQRQAVFALPGNPVSALVCAVRYVLPALLSAMGVTAAAPEWVCLDASVDAHPNLTCFVPAQVRRDSSGRAMARPVPVRTSGDFSTLPGTQGFLQLPPGRAVMTAGTPVPFYRW